MQNPRKTVLPVGQIGVHFAPDDLLNITSEQRAEMMKLLNDEDLAVQFAGNTLSVDPEAISEEMGLLREGYVDEHPPDEA